MHQLDKQILGFFTAKPQKSLRKRKDRNSLCVCSAFSAALRLVLKPLTTKNHREKPKTQVITNVPDQMEFFYENQLYLTNPYFRHPSLFESGYAMNPVTTNRTFQERTRSLFRIDHFFLILKKCDQGMKIYFFSKRDTTLNDCAFFLHHLQLLNSFSYYFDREAQLLINNALELGYNCDKILGKTFHDADPLIPLCRKDKKASQFLKSISPLTLREHSVLELYKQGNSAQSTTAKLNISPRTVEHHFENIKDKLGCYSKSELLNF